MKKTQPERRETLRILGAISATCAFPYSADELYAQHAHGSAPPAKLPEKPRFFSAAEFAVITKMADLIIPETDTPGAVKAGVPAYIDYVVSENANAQKLCRSGLQWLDGECKKRHKKPFVDLTEAEQTALLKPLSDKADRDTEVTAQITKTDRTVTRTKKKKPLPLEVSFFRTVKGLTADGYYTSEVGLMHELGYKGNSVLTEFPSCVHEH